jgi:hypothetical protein
MRQRSQGRVAVAITALPRFSIATLTLLTATALAGPAVAQSPPVRFDLVCTQPIHLKGGSKFMDAKFLRTIDRSSGRWCEATCSTVHRLREEGRRLILDESRNAVGPGAFHLSVDLRTLVASKGVKDASGWKISKESCRLRPFSGFQERPPPF